jgi:hypothetical protein
MIVIETNKIYCLYVRKNRRVKWRYAEYGGRYETIEKAIDAVKEHFPGERVEYLIENLDSDETIQGFIN